MNGVNGHANGPTSGFLSFNSQPPRVHITAEDNEFDEQTLQYWRDEGKLDT
jgi:carboxymethylenebutenolidase